MADSEVLERQRLVADAIILERAAMVLQRRGTGRFTARVLIRVLLRAGTGLRRDARRAGDA